MSKQRNSTSLLSDLKSKVVALKEAIKRIEDTKIEISSSASEVNFFCLLLKESKIFWKKYRESAEKKIIKA